MDTHYDKNKRAKIKRNYAAKLDLCVNGWKNLNSN
jgi:hypothetical protein